MKARALLSELRGARVKVSPERWAELEPHLDELVDLDDSARKCQSCHHDPEMNEKLTQMVAQVDQY